MKEVQDMLDDSQIPTAETIVTKKGKTVQGSKGVRWASPLANTGSKENESDEDDDDEFTVAQLNEIGDDDSPDEELYPEEASLDVIEVPKTSAVKMELTPTQPRRKTAGRAKTGAKPGPKSLKLGECPITHSKCDSPMLDGTICLGVHSRDRLLRTIRIEPSESYDRLVLAVRKHVNDLNSDLELAYSLAWMAKSERHALETQDDWEELIQVIAGNKRKLPGQHHALLYHFLDKEAPAQGVGKGKGKKKRTSGEIQDLTAVGTGSVYGLLYILNHVLVHEARQL
jgi:hypothetical protein